MDGFDNITLKSFRGGISPEGDKGPVGSFKFGKNLNIHGGRDTLKSNQAMKLDGLKDGTTIGDLPIVFLATSDGNKYAFGDTGKIYRKQGDGAWSEVYDAGEKISGAIEYQSSSANWMLFTTKTKLYKIRVMKAGLISPWTSGDVTEVGELTPEVYNSFVVTLNAAKRSFWVGGRINPSDSSVKPEPVVSKRVSQSSSAASISTTIDVPANSNQTLIAIAGCYGGGTIVTSMTAGGEAMTARGSGSGSAGGFSVTGSIQTKDNPSTGTITVTANYDVATVDRFLYILVFKGVNQADSTSNESSGFPNEGSGENTTSTFEITPLEENSVAFALIMADITDINTHNSIEIESGDTGSTGVDALYYRVSEIVEIDHPMETITGNVAIANGNKIALYDFQDAYNNSALPLPPNVIAITLLTRTVQGNGQLIIGSRETVNQNSWIVTWDGSSPSWTDRKPVMGDLISAMGFLEGGVLMPTGNEGILKFWNYGEVYPFNQIPGVKNSKIGAVAEHRSLTMFGMSGGTKNGVYSIGRFDRSGIIAMNLEYVPSHGQTEDCEIGALLGDGDDLYIGWKRTYESGGSEVTEYGIDITDQNNKAVSVYESLELSMGNNHIDKLIKQIKMLLTETIPTGAEVQVECRATSEPSDWQVASTGDGQTKMTTGKKIVYNLEAKGEVYEVRVTITPNGNETPEIRSLSNYFNALNSL